MKRVFTICLVSITMTVFGQAADTTTKTVLTFEEAVKIGLKRNVALNQQKNQLIATQAQRLNSYGNFIPNVSISGGWTHQSGNQQNSTSGDLEDIDTDYINGGLNANVSVFNGGRTINTLFQSNKQVLSQSYLIKRSTQDVVSLVANQYLLVLLDQELLKIAEENLRTQNTLLEQMQAFVEVGSRAMTDVYNQDALMKAAQVSSIRARSTLLNDKAALAQLLQLDPNQNFAVVYPKFENDMVDYNKVSLDSLTDIALENRADLKQFRYQAEANKFALRSAFANYLPNISLFAGYSTFYYSQIAEGFGYQFRTFNPSLQYGANITIPIFTRFQPRYQRALARVAYDNSVLNEDNLYKTVKIDVQRAHNNLINATEAYYLSLSQFQAGELALQTQKESYDLGISAQVAVAQANQTYILGAASKVQAEVTLLFQKILLQYSLGTLRVDDYTGSN
jgi:outer membrane protein